MRIDSMFQVRNSQKRFKWEINKQILTLIQLPQDQRELMALKNAFQANRSIGGQLICWFEEESEQELSLMLG